MKRLFDKNDIPKKAVESLPDGYTLLGAGNEYNYKFPCIEMLCWDCKNGWDSYTNFCMGSNAEMIYAMNTQDYNLLQEKEKEKHTVKITMQQKEEPVEMGQLYMHSYGNVYMVVRVTNRRSDENYSLINISTGDRYGYTEVNIEDVFGGHKNLFKKVVASEVIIKL